MKKQFTPQIIMSSVFSLGIALLTVYYIGDVVLQMPPSFVIVLAFLVVAIGLIGITIGIWIRSKKSR
jgi:hypothetical protein